MKVKLVISKETPEPTDKYDEYTDVSELEVVVTPEVAGKIERAVYKILSEEAP